VIYFGGVSAVKKKPGWGKRQPGEKKSLSTYYDY
jgi:hypothetical protein